MQKHSKPFHLGFTLVEILVALTIASFIILVIASFFLSMNISNTRTKADREVQENARRVMDVMIYSIKTAKSIYTPTTTSSQLSLETTQYLPTDEIITYLDFFLCGTDLCLKKEGQDPIVLNSDTVEVTSISFTRVLTKAPSYLSVSQSKTSLMKLLNAIGPREVFAQFPPPPVPPPSTFEQSAYRWFNNANSTDVSNPLADQNSSAITSSSGDPFRLRLLIHMGEGLGINGQNFKLQFSRKSGACDAGFSGETYQDVTALTEIAYNDNSVPSDGDALTFNGADPTHGFPLPHTIVGQSYEEANNFTNSISPIVGANDAKWDFALKNNSAPASTSFCFRVVKSDGSLLDTYSVIPEIMTCAVGLCSGAPPGIIPSVQITLSVRYKNPSNDPISTYSLTLTSTSSLRGY